MLPSESAQARRSGKGITIESKKMTQANELPIIRGLRLKPLHSGETVKVEVTICDHTKNGDLCADYLTWVGLVTKTLCDIAGGCTRVEGRGCYVSAHGETLHDGITLLTAVCPREKLVEGLSWLRHRLFQYGKECEQESVLVGINGELYLIDPSEEY